MKRPEHMPERHAILWLMGTLTAAALPHFIYQPFWVGLMFALMMGWRLQHELRGWPLPSVSRGLKLLHLGGAALAIALMFGHFGSTIGRDAGAALLTMMLAFKLVELRSLRDYYLSVYLGFFVVITNFFYMQSLLMVLFMLIVVLLLTSCLLSVNATALPPRRRLKLAGRMVLQALPLMLILFVLFPRVSGPIWGLQQEGTVGTESMSDQITLGDMPPDGGNRGVTGTSEQIQLGKISQLIQSDAIAFRVEFDDNHIPPPDQRYWRGPVLWESDGTIWSPLPAGLQTKLEPAIAVRGDPIRYTMTLEPHNRGWLFALDFPTRLPPTLPSSLSADGRLDANTPVRERTQYQLQSHSDYRFNADNEPLLRLALQLPENRHPRTRALAAQWRQETDSPEQFIDRVLQHFSEEAFHYTLQPPVLRGDTVDGFLFETRSGFCEHYAASFTVLMRAADIPARIVTGYLGGDVNPVGRILTVRQRDAHAWTEVWLQGRGWVRIDPTAAVSSERIELGMRSMLPTERRTPRMLSGSDRLTALWDDIRNNWDAFNSAWDLWVVGYDPIRQIALLSMLGMANPDWRKMTVMMVLLILFSVLVMMLVAQRRRRDHDPLTHLYRRFCAALARAGVTREPHEGPLDLASRARQALPAQREHIDAISQLYMRLRYGGGDAALLDELAARIKAFRPGRRS